MQEYDEWCAVRTGRIDTVVVIVGVLLRPALVLSGGCRAAINFTLIAGRWLNGGGTSFIGNFRPADSGPGSSMVEISWVCFSWSRCAYPAFPASARCDKMRRRMMLVTFIIC